MKLASFACLAAVFLPSFVAAQLSGPVGPTTTRAQKNAKKVCNVLNYGGQASKTADIGPPLASAFAACKTGGTVYVPPGDYGMTTWVTLSGGTGWALQLDGIIYRVGTAGGNMIAINGGSDFEMYSSTSAGAIQGYGYTFHKDGNYGARLLRLIKVNHFSVHDIALVDAPQFHLFLDTCQNGEVYNTIIYGAFEGGLDGIDVSGNNIHIHDVEVSNKDECVTIKSAASNMLIENIHCNWSGGCAMGSLGASTAISNIVYRNIYTIGSNQMYMIKSNGGDGYVKNCSFNNFIGHGNAYSLDINGQWAERTVDPGNGVLFTDLEFDNWKGTAANGVQRGPINVVCPTAEPCTGISISNFALWTDSGKSIVYKCQNGYGSGGCLKAGSGASYAMVTQTMTAAPAGYSAPTMPNDLKTGFPISASIPIPKIPTTFYPGATPASKLLGIGNYTGNWTGSTSTSWVAPSGTGGAGTWTSSVANVTVKASPTRNA